MERIQAAIRKAKEQRTLGAATAGGAAPRPTIEVAGAVRPGATPQPRPRLEQAWEALMPFTPDPARLRDNRIVSADRSGPAHMPFDLMRTKLLRTVREKKWTRVAVTSPTSGCGKTMACANLAFSFAHQQDVRTVLIDLDLRRPALATTLDLPERGSIEAFLQGGCATEDVFLRYGQGLALAGSRMPAPNPAELLHHPAAGEAIAAMQAVLRPDIVIYDMPPMLTCDDVTAFIPNIDCVLLIAAVEVSTLDEIDRCERDLSEQTNVLGVVVNKSRYATESYGYY